MDIKDIKIILASSSPRRRDILLAEGANPLIIPSDCGEEVHSKLPAGKLVMSLAFRKGINVLERLSSGNIEGICEPDDFLLIASDTAVVFEDEIFGKPKDFDDAVRMLRAMNGKINTVFSGVFLYRKKDGKKICFYEKTDVWFKQYSDEDILNYVAGGEPMDKAGAYAIQGGFSGYIDHIDGYYDNIVGLPLERIKYEAANLQL